jgi:hypothetical protein
MGPSWRGWRWLACLALAGGCALNPQPDLPGDTQGNSGSVGVSGSPPILNGGGSAGMSSGAGAQPSGSGGTSPGGGDAGFADELEGGAPSFGEGGQAGAAEAGAWGTVSH